MTKRTKLSLIIRTTSSQISRHSSMCGERDSLRAKCNTGESVKWDEEQFV